MKGPLESWARRRVRRRAQDQWPDALLFLSGALKAGLGLEEALEALQQEVAEPLRSELKSCLDGNRAWVPLEARIETLFSDPSLALAKAALLLSHEAGGKVAGLLEKTADILRQKTDLKEKINVMTAQGKASAWIVGLSPFGLAGSFLAVAPDYIEPLFTTRTGWGLLGLVAVMVSAGLFCIHRAARPEPG